MKYRRLKQEELQEMEPEFVRFLAANTVTADDWVKIKQESPEKAEQLIDMFSDIVFDKILDGVEYLEYKISQDYKTFHFLEEKVVMRGVMVQGETDLDFTQPMSPEQMSGKMQEAGAHLKLYKAEKKYTKGKKAEMFKMMENGALISRDGGMYKLLESLASN